MKSYKFTSERLTKRILFIAGTSYSGSTLLDLILANDDDSTSLGEIEAIFHPFKKHHLVKIRGLKSDPLWGRKLKEGAGRLYYDLHESLGVSTIVDSSKNPAWIRFQIENLSDDIEWHVILVHKSLSDLKHSFEKRGRYNWIDVYKNYHSLFFRNVKRFQKIEYSEIPRETAEFSSLLNKLGVAYCKERSNFWEQNRTNFFGNNNTNRSFVSSDDNKALEYVSHETPEVSQVIEDEIKKDSSLSLIHSYLNSNNSSCKAPVFSGILTNYTFRKLIRQVRVILVYIKNPVL